MNQWVDPEQRVIENRDYICVDPQTLCKECGAALKDHPASTWTSEGGDEISLHEDCYGYVYRIDL